MKELKTTDGQTLVVDDKQARVLVNMGFCFYVTKQSPKVIKPEVKTDKLRTK